MYLKTKIFSSFFHGYNRTCLTRRQQNVYIKHPTFDQTVNVGHSKLILCLNTELRKFLHIITSVQHQLQMQTTTSKLPRNPTSFFVCVLFSVYFFFNLCICINILCIFTCAFSLHLLLILLFSLVSCTCVLHFPSVSSPLHMLMNWYLL